MITRHLYSRILHPAYHWIKKDGVNVALAELKHNESLTAPALAETCGRKLQALLTFAANNVPYYARIIAEAGGSVDALADPARFRKLPVLTKSIIRQHLHELISRSIDRNRLVKNSTSGSTGEALHFYTDFRSSAYRKAAVIRNKSWVGVQPGAREVRLWGSPIDETAATKRRGRLHGRITGMRFLSAYEMTERNMDEYISLMRDFQPVLVVSYPSVLEVFAQHCIRRGASFDSLRSIITSAETLDVHQRQFFEETFSAHVYNRYGCREVGDIAHECSAQDGLHLNQDRIYVEVLSDAGEPCAPGETGEILVTDLDNYGMPFIRYQIADNGRLLDQGTCRCGLSMQRLATVEGRSMDVVKAPNGNQLGGTFWTILLRSRPGMRQFQVYQRELGGVTIKYLPDGSLPDETKVYFEQEIRRKCGADFQVSYEEVSALENTSSGKRKIVISEISSPQYSSDNSASEHIAGQSQL